MNMTTSNQLYLAIFMITTTIWMHVLAQITELTYVILEETPALTLVGNVLEDSKVRSAVSTSDIFDLRFTFLAEKNPHALQMWINSTSGELRTSSRINRETICHKQPTCNLRLQTVIQAQLGSFFKIIQLKITLTDINDNEPTFIPSTHTIQIPESATPGASFRLPTAIDLDSDPDNVVTEYNQLGILTPFSLIVDGNSSSFDVRIRLDSNLDRETVSRYQIFIRAIDGGRPRLTGTLTVNVEVGDVNDNSPVFLQQGYSANISDSLAVGGVVVVVKATDLDAGNNGLVGYHLASVQDDLIVFEMFEINRSTGEVRSKVTLDSYAGRNYRLTIEAQDSGSSYKTSRTDVIISVEDTHNSQPEILLNVFGAGGIARVSELAELGRVVAHLAVTDPDSGLSPNGQVSCLVNMADRFQLQPMDVRQFKVILTKRLDREQQATHSVTILCEDFGTPPLNVSSSFTVTVDDENDNAPEFNSPNYTTQVVEGKPRKDGHNYIIMTVNASDRDTGPNAQITYRLADGADSDFGLYADGSIVVTNPSGLDREDAAKGGVRHLVVLAVDSGKPQLTSSTTVTVSIQDINDNPPKFSEPVYFFQVAEDVSINHIINNISAVDIDSENNGLFYFKMHPRYSTNVPFEISSSGAVKLSGDIDRESIPSYQFYVIANDMGNPQQSSTVEVRIQISDVNDNLPEIVFPNNDNHTVYIPHTQGVHTVFANIIAKDVDEGENSELVYMSKSGNSSRYFDVQPQSGQIVLLRELTSKEVGLHILHVSVHDRGVDVQLTSKSILHIIVYEDNVTVSFQDYGLGFRNVVISIVLVVITTTLTFTILITIFLIRRVDKHKRFYSTSAEAFGAESKLKQLNPDLTRDPESVHTTARGEDTTKDGEKKKKEVSFVLEDITANSKSMLWVTSPAVLDQYDSVCVRLEEEMKTTDSGLDHDDTGSDSSGTIKACDSGKGDSDVEVQSSTSMSRDTCGTSFIPQNGLNPRSDPCVMSNRMINTSYNNYRNTRKAGHQSPIPFGLPRSSNSTTSFWPRTPIYPRVPSYTNDVTNSKYNQNVVSPENKSFVNRNKIHHSSLSNRRLGNNTGIMLNDSSLSNQNNCCMISTNQKRGSLCLPEDVIYKQKSSNSCLDDIEAWDGDTTTSGSYTVDPHELTDEIDTFFFGNKTDVLV